MILNELLANNPLKEKLETDLVNESHPHSHTHTNTFIYELLIVSVRRVDVPLQYCRAVGVCPAHNRRPMWQRQAHILR